MSTLHLKSAGSAEHPLRQKISINGHVLEVDASVAAGGTGSAPDPHDLFDAALAACKALTLKLYARHKGWPLEDVEVELVSDASAERQGQYGIDVVLRLHGDLDDSMRAQLLSIADRCPIHKLMTTSTVTINTRLAE